MSNTPEPNTEFGLFGLDFALTKRMLTRLLKPYGLTLKVKTRREDDQSTVWLESSSGGEDAQVGAALAELRDMFPDKWFELEITHNPGTHPSDGFWYWIRVYGKPRQGQGIPTLTEAMQKVREWKESNG